MTPALHPYRVHCAGLQYITLARSACEAMLSAIEEFDAWPKDEEAK